MAIRAEGTLLAVAVAAGMLAATGILLWAPAAAADGCAPGFTTNPYNGQCLAPVTVPIINGVPCVASKLGLCQSFVQNQQPPSRP